MFAHVLTNSNDETLVKTRWEEFTGESVSKYRIVRVKLSAVDSDMVQTLSEARKEEKLIWIEADVNLDSIPTELQQRITYNTVLITHDETLVMEVQMK